MRELLSKAASFFSRLVTLLHLKPVSVAGKCRLFFGSAIILILILALMIPYYWMDRLSDKISLDAGRAIADTVYERHFHLQENVQGLARLTESGTVRDPNDFTTNWIKISSDDPNFFASLNERQLQAVQKLQQKDEFADTAWVTTRRDIPMINYIALVRAADTCISCHNPKGPAPAMNQGQQVGVIVARTPARQLSRIVFLNRLAIVVAGALAGIGAIVAFYVIAQRIILRPIRQLRAMVNNIAEGNLNARASIKTQDEYQRLSDAFNAMLDGLQESQEKLRQANVQLDAKIAELSDRNIELYKANKIKSEFLANMSHEFRTPLNAILGFADILKERNKEEKCRRYAENIITSGRNLLNMINDLLELAKAEAGKLTLHVERTSIPDLCRGLVSFFGPLVDNRKLQMELNIDPDIPVIQTDPNKVQQILYNFVSNAIKFTPENGKIEITASMVDDKTVRVAVSDTGCGIAKQDQDKIFDKFRQADGSITRHTTGSGLGLAISKELAMLLAGRIGLESSEGQGATFWLDMPVALKGDQPDMENNSELNQNKSPEK